MKPSNFLLLLLAGLALALPTGASPVEAGPSTVKESLSVAYKLWTTEAVDALSTTEAADAPRVLIRTGYPVASEASLRSRYGFTNSRDVGRHGWASWRIGAGLDPRQVAASIVCLDAAHSPCADADALVRLPPMVTRAADIETAKTRLDSGINRGENGQETGRPDGHLALPNDPLFPQQWHLPFIGMETAFQYGDADAMRVAVLDTGITATHPDLAPAIESGYDVVNGDTIPEDVNGHGTAVAGVVSAVCDNGIGICGVGKGSLIIPIKVFADNGTARVSDLVKGVDLAASMAADVVVMSWGYPTSTAALASAIQDAAAQGVAFVAAAGNDGQAYPPIFPASDPRVLSVGGLNRDGTRRATANQVGMQGLMAPGSDILTTSVNGGYAFVDGSSVAAPVVAGCLLAIRRQKLTRTPRAAQDVLRYSARTMGPGVGANAQTGWGALDCSAAMALEARSPIPTPTRTATPYATAAVIPTTAPSPTERGPASTPTPWVVTATPPPSATPTGLATPTMAGDAFLTAVAIGVQTALPKKLGRVVYLPVALALACRTAEPCPGWGGVP